MALVPVAVLLPMCTLCPKQYVLVLRRGGGIPKRQTSMHGNACPGHNCCNSGLHRTRSAAYKNLAAHTGSPAQSLPRGSTHAPKRWPRKARTRASSCLKLLSRSLHARAGTSRLALVPGRENSRSAAESGVGAPTGSSRTRSRLIVTVRTGTGTGRSSCTAVQVFAIAI